MKPGKVVSIRVNPRDCLSVLDVTEKLGLPADASYSMHVSLALAALLETARQNGLVPTREGFEYNEMMGRFAGTNRARALNFAAGLSNLGSEIKTPAIGMPSAIPPKVEVLPPFDPEGDIPFIKYKPKVSEWTPEETRAEHARQKAQLLREREANAAARVARGEPAELQPIALDTPEQREIRREFRELLAKKQASATTEGIYWGIADDQRFKTLHLQIFGEPYGGA